MDTILVSRALDSPGNLLPTTLCMRDFAQALCQSLLGNSSPEAGRLFELARPHAVSLFVPAGSTLIRGSSLGELSGIDLPGRELRIGSPEAIAAWLSVRGSRLTPLACTATELLARHNRTALIVADSDSDLGVIDLDAGALVTVPAGAITEPGELCAVG